jgi:hypothetical protein
MQRLPNELSRLVKQLSLAIDESPIGESPECSRLPEDVPIGEIAGSHRADCHRAGEW